MPVFRNVRPSRQSGRLGKQVAVVYGKDGWPITEGVDITSEITSPSISSHSPSPGSHHQAQSPYARSASPLVGQEHSPPVFVPSDAGLCSTPSSSSTTSPPPTLHPARKSAHARRKDPAHIPRPRNAFIFFRSSYITSAASGAEGQQNELSKHAGKVWNRMGEEERRPFVERAMREKREHAERYPDYVYAPGGGRGTAKAKARRTSAPSTARRKTAVAAPKSWSREETPEEEEETPGHAYVLLPRSPRVRRAAAQRARRRITMPPSLSPEKTPSPCLAPTPDRRVKGVSPPPDLPQQDDFVPTDEIPELVLNPPEEEEAKVKIQQQQGCTQPDVKLKTDAEQPTFDLTTRPFHYDCPGPQFAGFKSYANPVELYSCLPPIPPISTGPSPASSPLTMIGVSMPFPPASLGPLNLRYPSSTLALSLHSAYGQSISQPHVVYQFYELSKNQKPFDFEDVSTFMDFESFSSSSLEGEELAYPTTDSPYFPTARETWEAEQAQVRKMEEMYLDFDAVAMAA